MSNIGYYKYSWGPVGVKKQVPLSTTDVASGVVTGRVALNMNLGFTPGTAVESTAMSPYAATNSIQYRECWRTSANPYPCVVTAVYRSSGGAVLSQSFSPSFTNNNQSSSVTVLPSGVTAVSTPKIIEDTSQMPTRASGVAPARLRTFVKGADGNIYMSRYDGGRWNPWLSLGRPWTCTTASANCTALQDPKNGPLVRAPFTLNPQSAAALTAGSTYSGQPNDGISIAGEPMIASYMDTAGGMSVIAIFVRVSQLKSSDGMAGPWHNTVFYTFATSTAGYPGAGQTLDFDNVNYWQPWMPVQDGTDNFAIQGNPTVFAILNNGHLRLYAMGTSSFNSLPPHSEVNLHPPVAPNTATPFPATPVNTSYWYNYGSELIWTALNITGVQHPTAYPGALPTTPAWDSIQSTTATTDGAGNASTGMGIVSDWAIAPVGSEDVSQASRIRVMASQLLSMNYPDGNGANQLNTSSGTAILSLPSMNPAALFSFTWPRSPVLYKRDLVYLEFNVTDNDAAAGLTAAPACQGEYLKAEFFGDISPVSFAAVAHANAASGDPIGGGYRNFVFGRSVCPYGSIGTYSAPKCDPSTPTVAYAVMRTGTNCTQPDVLTPTYDMYYATYSRQVVAGTATDSTNVMLPTFNPTSDVVAIRSYASDAAGIDVPVYLMTRAQDGTFSHGFFNGSTTNKRGAMNFSIFKSGGFTN
jgi:hypothetical protein